MARAFCIFFGIVGFIAANCQTKNSFNKFTVNNGLPGSLINCITLDEDGFMWVGTSNGLSRYDGSEFKNYYHQVSAASIPGNKVNFLYSLPPHKLLVATETGLCLFNTATGEFKTLLIKSNDAVFYFENNFIAAAPDSNNNIWAGTNTCLYKLDSDLNILKTYRGFDKNDINITKLLFVQAIEPVAKSLLLMQLQGKGYAGFLTVQPGGDTLLPFNKVAADPLHISSQTLMRSVKAGDGRGFFFISHLVDSLFYFDIKKNAIKAVGLNKYASPNQFYYGSKILLVNDEFLCCSLSGGGVLLVSKPYDLFASPAQQPGVKIILGGEIVNTATYDTQNNLWFGTGNGLFKYKTAVNDIQTTYFQTGMSFSGETPENSVIQITPDKIFVTTSANGFFYKNRNSDKNIWQNITWADCRACNNTWNVRAINADTCWIGTEGGLYWWVSKNNSHGPTTWPMQFNAINSVPITTQFSDSKGLVWMGLGFGTGVAAFNSKTNQVTLYSHASKNASLPIRHPHAVAEDDEGNIWMGGQDGTGLVKWNRNTKLFSIKAPSYNTLFDNAVIYSMLADKRGNIWVGGYNGLLQFNTGMQAIKKFDVTGGLTSNQVYALDLDSSNRLWIATANGVNYLDVRTGAIVECTDKFGLQDSVITSIKFDSSENRLYYTTIHSVNSINLKGLNILYPPLKILITDIASAGKSILYKNQPVGLSYHFNNLTISFTAPDLSDGPLNNYYYRFDNKKEWVALGHQRQINFYSLSPGPYIFHVKARGVNGLWSANEATLSFVIATPFYREWWFILASIAAACAIAYLLYMYRIKQLLSVQNVRNKIAADLHDDIGSTLTNINILAELSSSSINDTPKVSDFLKRISEEVNATSESLDDIVWSINTNNDSFSEMAARMRRYTADLLEPADIKYDIQFDSKLTGKKLQMEQRRDIYLMFKEAINNIYKHAGAKHVNASLCLQNGKLVIAITDDGKGFDPQIQTGRNGLKNMQARAQKWHGNCTVASSVSHGTTVSITMAV